MFRDLCTRIRVHCAIVQRRLHEIFHETNPESSATAWLVLAAQTQADVVIDWNARADAIAADKRLSSPVHGRGLAIMHVAMFEALNAIDGATHRIGWTWSPIATLRAKPRGCRGARGDDQPLPGSARRSRCAARTAARAVSEGDSKERGPSWVARQRRRQWSCAHGTALKPRHVPAVTQPGVYVTTAPVAFHRGLVVTLGLESAAQFRAGPPPALTWRPGRGFQRNSRARGTRQRRVPPSRLPPRNSGCSPAPAPGIHWWRRLPCTGAWICWTARACSRSPPWRAWTTSDVEAKYHYNFWRPVSAVRNADTTGNL